VVAPVIAIWLGVSILFWLAAIRINAARLGMIGRVATGLLMLLTAAGHAIFSGGTDVIAWVVDIALVAGGSGLVFPLMRQAPKVR